mgnify:CR=1 FL=1|tara:strand:- start:737 stop:1477 length:741 start_codon:yes stop_codon:yes gene_type:complete
MIYRILLLFTFFLSACVNGAYQSNKAAIEETSTEKGFVLIYEESLKKDKILRKKIENDELQVIHNKIKKNSFIDIFNPINSKSLKAKVIAKDNYPNIYRLVVSKKIAEILELDLNNPYVEFSEIKKNKTFIAKKSETFQEEREVAEKAPVKEVLVADLSKNKKSKKIKKNNTKFYILISDFYYLESAQNLKKNLNEQIKSNKLSINSINDHKHRLYLGPFKNFKSLQSTYIKLHKHGFTDLDIYQK